MNLWKDSLKLSRLSSKRRTMPSLYSRLAVVNLSCTSIAPNSCLASFSLSRPSWLWWLINLANCLTSCQVRASILNRASLPSKLCSKQSETNRSRCFSSRQSDSSLRIWASMGAKSLWSALMRSIAPLNGHITSVPLISCFTRWLGRSSALPAVSLVWLLRLQSRPRSRSVGCSISSSQSIWLPSQISPAWTCTCRSLEIITRQRHSWPCSSQTPTKIWDPFSYSQPREELPTRLQASSTRTVFRLHPIMLERLTSRGITPRSSSFRTKSVSCAVRSLSLWVSTRVTFNRSSTTICQEPLRTMCRRLEELVVMAPSHVAICSWTMRTSTH